MAATEPWAGPAGEPVAAVDRAWAGNEERYRLIVAGIEALASSPRTRVEDVTRAAGLPPSSFHQHFGSMDELIAAILQDGSRRLAGYLEHRMSKQDDPRARITAWITGLVEQAGNQRVAGQTRSVLVQTNQSLEPMRTPGGPSDILRQLLLEPLGALGSVDPERDSIMLAEGVIGFTHRYVQHQLPVEPADLVHVVRFSLQAVGADPDGALPADLQDA